MEPRQRKQALVALAGTCALTALVTWIVARPANDDARANIAQANVQPGVLPATPSVVLEAPVVAPARAIEQSNLCTGKVIDENRDGVRGVQVEVGLECGAELAHLAWAASDPDGLYRAPFAIPDTWKLCPSCRVWARVDAQNKPRRRSHALVAEHDSKHTLDLFYGLGGMLFGSVVDAHELAVAKAEVRLYQASAPGRLGAARTDNDGTFALHFLRGGTYELVALAKGHGSTQRPEQWIDDGIGSDEPLKIMLDHPDTIAGVLTDPEEHPLANVELWAFPAQLSAAGDRALWEWRVRPEAILHTGERSMSARTDDAGHFHLDGLAPGTYFLAPKEDLGAAWAQRQSFATGDERARLVVPRWELMLVCVDRAGRSLPDARAFCAPINLRGPSDYLVEPKRTTRGSNDSTFEVDGCRRYLCGFVHPERGVVEEDIFIPRDEYHVTRTLVLGEHGRAGTLDVELLELGRGFGADPRRVRVRSAASGVILWNWTQYQSASYTLPPGEYSLELADPPPKSWNAAWGDLRLEELLLWKGSVRVKAGEETRADIRF